MSVRVLPELLTTDQGWVNEVLKKVHKSPISRIRTRQADLRNIEALRAKGYKKGAQKGYVGNIQLLHRTTDPQTVYVKSKLDRDDIIDIQDFDVVQYLYGIDRMNLNEELATAIMIGDGREVGADGKIAEDKIRPIWLDDELYTIHADVDIAGMKTTLQGTNTSANFGENYIYAEAVIQSLLYAREKYKGSGTPDFYCTPHLVNVMLLARDLNGRRIYDKVSDLAAALNVGQIITAEQFEGKTRTTTDSKTKKLLGLMVNLADYPWVLPRVAKSLTSLISISTSTRKRACWRLVARCQYSRHVRHCSGRGCHCHYWRLNSARSEKFKMAKFYGVIGYAVTEETKPGVWAEKIIERMYYGDLTRNTRRLQSAEQLNDNINVANEISIVADPFANENFHSMRYVEFMGAKWKVTSVEVQYPRLILAIGGVYNGEQA